MTRFVGLSFVIGVGTWMVAWWFVPLAGAAYGAWAWRERGGGLTAALAGGAGWGALLVYDALVGPVGRLSSLFSDLFRLPDGALVAVTLAYAALLASAGAVLARSLRRAAAATN